MKKIVIVGAVIALFFGVWWFWGVNIDLLIGGSFSKTTVTKIKSHTVSLALGEILIFQTPNKDHGAIRFDKMTDDWGADYSYWFVPADESDPSFSDKTARKGHVFERYWRTRTGKDETFVTDIGGNYTIDFGELKLEWSGSTWVYFPVGFKIAVLQSNGIEEIDISDPSIDWKETKWDDNLAQPGA